jgi:hypothetical protein
MSERRKYKERYIKDNQLKIFVENFILRNGRIPKPEELPRKGSTVETHFGSYEEMIDMAFDILNKTHGRKDGTKRYCRNCHKELEWYRWYFCDNNSCQEDFMAKDSWPFGQFKEKEEAEKIYGMIPEEENKKIYEPCVACDLDCRIRVPEKTASQYKIMCRKTGFGELGVTS